jgi:thiol-disulfide isomerase/thioredoxin
VNIRIAALLFLCSQVFASVDAREKSAPPATSKTVIYFFWAEGCPHCAEERAFLDSLVTQNTGLELRTFELLHSRDNARLLINFADRFGYKARSAPATFIGSRHWVGFTSQIAGEITDQIRNCGMKACPDAADYLARARPTPNAKATADSTSTETSANETQVILDVPVFGRILLTKGALWANTALIAFADGFNPCSLWVLTMLLALIIHTGSRAKIFLIGFVFLTVSSLVYTAFIAGVFSIMKLVGLMTWIRTAMAILTLAMGLINIKDYFWFGKGVSLTIASEKKPGILARMRQVLAASGSLWPMLLATIFLAGGVSLAEFSCTAGFPVLWVNLLTAQNVSTGDFTLLLAFYMLIYQLDEMVIFIAVVLTLRIGRFQEKQGRILKLFGGTLMCTLAAVLLLRPNLLENLTASLLVFAAALLGAATIFVMHRSLLHLFGVKIGSDRRM